MNELQRQQYLEAIGVESYMPRWILPFAPTSRRCEVALPVEQQSPQQSPQQPIQQPIQQPPKAEPIVVSEKVSIEEVVVDQPAAVDPVKSTDAPVAAVSAPLAGLMDEPSPPKKSSLQDKLVEQAQVKNVRFDLSFWRMSDDLLVFDSRQADLALPVDALLSNMMLALGYPQAALPKVEVIRWPRPGNAYSDKSETAARSMLDALLFAKSEQKPFKYLLLMGADAARHLLSQEHLPTPFDWELLLGKSVRLESLAATAIVVPSLSELLLNPLAKSAVWSAIQPLRLK